MTETAPRVYEIWPNRVVIGAGTAATRIAAELARVGCSRVLVVTDRRLLGHPAMNHLIAALHRSVPELLVYDDVLADPTDRDIEEIAAFMAGSRPDGIVAIGGGSPIDAAKCANLIYTHGGSPPEFVRGGPRAIEAGRLLPLVAVPTTAGTASEVTSVSVVIDSSTGRKMSVGGPPLVPSAAVLDPEMTVSLPPHLTAATGADALTHLIEAYVSTEDFAPADGIALAGIRMAGRALPAVVADGSDLALREEMLVASMMGGIAFNHCRLGLTHAMAHQLTTTCGLHHGLANGILLPHVMRYNHLARPDRYAAVAQALGADGPAPAPGRTGDSVDAVRTAGVRGLGARGIEIVEELCRAIRLPPTLADVGVKPEDIPSMAEAALADSVIRKNPRPATLTDVEALYRAALTGSQPAQTQA
jgi:4-hydroxybutyrate dehydrogenase